MLHLHCTSKLAKALKTKLTLAPNAEELDWLNNWYVRDIQLNAPLDALLFTNGPTFYSLVHPFDRRESIEEITTVFQQRLAWLIGKEITHHREPSPFAVCKTASRRILGCMNELAIEIEYIAEAQFIGDGISFENIEERLNNGIIGGLSPQREFQNRLETNTQTNSRPRKSPQLRLVK